MRDETQKNRLLETELERLAVEGDEIASRLGLDIQKRIIKINEARWYGRMTLLGGLVSLGIGYALFPEMPEPFYFDSFTASGLVRFITAAPGIIAGMPLEAWIDNKIEKREYDKLEKEFPEKIQDIRRCCEVINTYNYLLALSSPPAG